MNAIERAQINHDNAGPADEEWNEVNEYHVDAAEAEAEAEFVDNPGALWDALNESAFYLEYMSELFQASPKFRKWVFGLNKDRITKRAQELADEEARQNADEAEFERAEMLREGDR